MTSLGKVDGASGTVGASYLDMVSNTDDHMRNHGFILTKKGWRLSPLYDVNPIPYGNMLSLNVSMDDNSISIQLAVSVAKYFDLEKEEAVNIANEIKLIVKDNWEMLAKKCGLSRNACEYMRPAFSESYR